MKRCLIIISGMLLLALCLIWSYRYLSSPVVSVVSSESYLQQWYIKDGYVYLECHVVIQSRTRKNITFQVEAFSEDDFQHGLITTAKLECDIPYLQIGSNEQKSSFDIVFTAPHGTATTKTNRLIPETFILHSITVEP